MQENQETVNATAENQPLTLNQDEKLQSDPDVQRNERDDLDAPQTSSQPADGLHPALSEDLQKEYSLYELIRHPDSRRPAEHDDVTAKVLSSPRRSAWEF